MKYYKLESENFKVYYDDGDLVLHNLQLENEIGIAFAPSQLKEVCELLDNFLEINEGI